MDLRKFQDEVKINAYTRINMQTHVLLLLMILRNSVYDEEGDVEGLSCSSSMLSAMETASLCGLVWIFFSFFFPL